MTRRVVGVVLAVLASCSGPEEAGDSDVAGAYAAVIEWFASPPRTSDDRPVVFVEARGEGFDIELGLQAAIISSSEPVADVRFIDQRSDALDEKGAVRDGGLLLALGSAVTEGDRVLIDCDELVREGVSKSWRFELEDGPTGWRVVRPPSEAP